MPAGATLDLPPRYRDAHHVANGGMAAVYAVQDAVLGRRVAIKLLAAHMAQDPDAVRRFQREARAAARVSQHPHVVTIYDVGEHDGQPFIVMELMEGGSLARVLREGVPSRADALRWVAEAASALDAAHERDVVHRDVKPGNLLLDDRRRLGVADFGIARLAYESAVTMTGQVLGTAAYVAPEQAGGEGATAASDRYALAVVAYELLTGKRPFAGGSFAAQARQHVEADPTPASAQRPELPAAADGVLARGLAKDPGARWETASEFAQALARAAGGDATEDATEATRPLAVGLTEKRPVGTPQVAAGGTKKRPVRGARPAAAKRPQPPPEPTSQPAVVRRRDARRWLPAALVTLMVLLIAVIALASGGGEERGADDPAASKPETPRSEPREQPAPAAPARPETQPAARSASDLNDQGFALMSQGRHGEAIPLLEQAVERCGDSREAVCAYALYNLGRSLRLAGRPAEAIPVLERRLGYDDQTEVVQAELDAARREAGASTSGRENGGDQGQGSGGDGKGGRGKGRDKRRGGDEDGD
jgi:eukaryotic-like serine/threonine-protein kinase